MHGDGERAARERTVVEFLAFGCSLDVLDAPEKVAMKVAYLDGIAWGLVDKGIARDTYDLLLRRLEGLEGLSEGGRLELESHLTPRPALEDHDRLNARDFSEFLDSGGCARVAGELGEFVRERVLPGMPLLLGVDHSLTGGVLEALSAEAGEGELALVVLDSHFDAVPTSIRKSAFTPGSLAADRWRIGTVPESYNCGTWIAGILDRGIIDPGNVAVLGVSDHPGHEARPGEREGVAAYREAYLAMEERGARIVPKRDIRSAGARDAVAKALDGLGGRRMYISLDADLGSGEEVRAVRFLDTIGLSVDEVIGLARALRGWIDSTGSRLAGVDVVEVDVHLADIPNSIDRTVEMCAAWLRELIG